VVGDRLARLAAARRPRGLVPAGWEYHLAGRVHPSPPHHIAISARYGSLPRATRILADISYDQFVAAYRAASIFWHAAGWGEDDRYPGRFEHFGIVTREAMSAGCIPVVIGKAGQIEIVTPTASMVTTWSPQQVSRRLVAAYPGDLEMRVSHETIYKWLLIQGCGALRKELTACLRTGRAQRRPHMRTGYTGAGRLQNMVLISERPPDAADRALPGHWEGDLIIGKGSRSAIGTLVERSSRYVVLLHLPNGRTAQDVHVALTRTLSKLPAELRRTLTWDQGKGMAEHVRFSTDTKMDVFFCDPHGPWQRGSNENTNGLLRQYFQGPPI